MHAVKYALFREKGKCSQKIFAWYAHNSIASNSNARARRNANYELRNIKFTFYFHAFYFRSLSLTPPPFSTLYRTHNLFYSMLGRKKYFILLPAYSFFSCVCMFEYSLWTFHNSHNYTDRIMKSNACDYGAKSYSADWKDFGNEITAEDAMKRNRNTFTRMRKSYSFGGVRSENSRLN